MCMVYSVYRVTNIMHIPSNPSKLNSMFIVIKLLKYFSCSI